MSCAPNALVSYAESALAHGEPSMTPLILALGGSTLFVPGTRPASCSFGVSQSSLRLVCVACLSSGGRLSECDQCPTVQLLSVDHLAPAGLLTPRYQLPCHQISACIFLQAVAAVPLSVSCPWGVVSGHQLNWVKAHPLTICSFWNNTRPLRSHEVTQTEPTEPGL